MAAEFKIGRLRFNWNGEWQPAIFYNRDAMVQYEGKMYVCLEPNTSSADFYSDLYAEAQDGAPTPYWNLIIDGKKWSGVWATTTKYSLGNIVLFGGQLYVCNTDHTSTVFLTNVANWDVYAQTSNWNIEWLTSYAYGINDVVKYGGIVYRCTVTHVSASTDTAGLEANIGSWAILNEGIEYKSYWNPSAIRYKKNDIVKYGANLWICSTYHTSETTFNESQWTLWLPGLEFANTWIISAVYQPGDTVTYGGYTYVSATVNNQGNTPSTDNENWTLFTLGYRIRGIWSSTTQYSVGDVVSRGGNLYEAVADTTTQNPEAYSLSANYVESGSSGITLKVISTTGIRPGMIVSGVGMTQGQTVVSVENANTVILSAAPDETLVDFQSLSFIGINYLFWKMVIPGSKWAGAWVENNNYSVGEVVTWKNATYTCIQAHTGILSRRPDNDEPNEFWIYYILHARKNALESPGDIEFFNNNAYDNLSIGTESYSLRNTNGVLSWAHLNSIPRIFYVATTGTDSLVSGWGETWDKPWKTIKFACNYVKNGTENVNAKQTLINNKAWLVEEMYQWMLYQVDQENTPFTSSSEFDEVKTRRDAEYIVDALVYDLSRGGNSQIVAATLAYFSYVDGNEFTNTAVAEQMPYFIAALTYLKELIGYSLNNSLAPNNYQTENGIPTEEQIVQATSANASGAYAISFASAGMDILLSALTNQTTADVPSPNTGITVTIYIKTGTYSETLPITVPANTAIVGDELRGVAIQPKIIINSSVLATAASENITYNNGTSNVTITVSTITVESTVGLVDELPIQFTQNLGTAITAGIVYYVIGESVTNTKFAVSETPGGSYVVLETNNIVTSTSVVGGDAISNMFYMRNGSGLRNVTLKGLLGTLGEMDEFEIRRPTGGVYVGLDPGEGPDDTTAWIVRRSPYVQNVTAFGDGSTALKIDGTLHNGGNKSIVCNDFTHIISDGIGIWCTGSRALCEAVSVFSYYGYAGYFAENGGRIRATNGNSSYGTYGVIAEGFDPTETPATGQVDNQSGQVQATVQSAFGSNAELLRLNYVNAGSEYTTTTTNLLNHSNDFESAGWADDGNVQYSKIAMAPSGIPEAWSLTGTSAAAGSGYIYQDITVNPPGQIYTAVTGVNISGTGGQPPYTPATFDITVTSTAYIVTVNDGGGGYVSGNQISISGALLGGATPANDCILTINALAGSAILSVFATGTVPQGSNQSYTLSTYIKAGTATTVELHGIFSGTDEVISSISYNFGTDTLTPSSSSGGFLPVNYGLITSSDDSNWYRLWFAFNDITGLNSNLQFRIYCKGASLGNITKSTYIYGTQVEISKEDFIPSFYLETNTDRYTAYANFNINGAGTGVVTTGDEIRSDSVFQGRISDGGTGYLTASNNAQSGNKHYIQLANSDTNTNSNYVGMRVFVNSGNGAGQYGYISYYDSELTKQAWVLKESFEALEIISTNATSDTLSLSTMLNTSTLYIDQPVQFIPTYYTTSVTGTSIAQVLVTEAIGGTTNTLTVASTINMSVNMPLQFTSTPFTNVTLGYTYYVYAIIDETTIQITEQLFGNVWPLVSGTGSIPMIFSSGTSYLQGPTANMVVNYAIQFTGTPLGGLSVGTTYYINDVIDGSNFTVSTSLVTVTVTATTSGNRGLTVSSTGSLVPLTPISFTGTTFGGIVEGQKYYISKIIDSFTFAVATSMLSLTATATDSASDLITVNSTASLVLNNPIKFVGNTFGNIIADQIYYVQVINSLTDFTISATPGGGAVSLNDATGSMTVRSCPTSFAVTSVPSGSMTGTSTSNKRVLTLGVGSMTGTFSTELFGNVIIGTDYYITNISVPTREITVSETIGGPTFALSTKTGSMKLAAVGWDHVNPGTPIKEALDNTSVYFIEPRTTFSKPTFSQTNSTTVVELEVGTNWASIAYGDGYWIALPNGNSTAAKSTDGTVWTEIALPSTLSWSSIAYGNNYWVAISSGGTGNSKAIYSNSVGAGWRTVNLPAVRDWNFVTYGNGKFVAVSISGFSAISTNFGASWIDGGNIGINNISGLTYGAAKFVVVSSDGEAAYSQDGDTWTISSPPTASAWSAVAYGNETFVAISNTSAPSTYSRDAVTWYESNLEVSGDFINYGQGIFVVLTTSSTTAWTSEAGENWEKQTVSSSAYSAVGFGWDDEDKGVFLTLNAAFAGSIIRAGVTTKGRVTISSGVINNIGIWEPGSGYVNGAGVTVAPTVTFTDPNVTALATVVARVSDGVLSSPTFINNGTGYNTNSTSVKITGNGYADTYQVGLSITLKNLTRLPAPGDNLTITGIDKIFKVTLATPIFGTTAPNLQANVEISPDIAVEDAVETGAQVSIRSLYSQARLTNHDFLNIGYGGFETSNYPGFPDAGYAASQQNQVVEVNFGRVFYTSTDQDGNFKVGSLFGVQQATGIVTLSASQFGLTGLETLSLGGIAVGGSSVIVTQFSTDDSFTANSDTIIPTQKAIKSYLNNRLSQGGSNTFTGQFIAGTILVGGPNKIASAVPNGQPGSVINMANRVDFVGANAGVDGGMAALEFFMRNSSHKTS
jgi:hypothetical protein